MGKLHLFAFVTVSLFAAFLSSSAFANSKDSSESVIFEEKIEYTVKQDDDLKSIAEYFSMDTDELVRENKLRNTSAIEPGKKLSITRRILLPKTMENGILINLPEYAIYHFDNGNFIKKYKIAIGKSGWKTPTGNFTVANKVIDPTWNIPPGMASWYNFDEKQIPPGPDNPLGKFWIGLSMPHIGIHSTYQTSSIGKARSHGCIRMSMEEAEELYSKVEIGTVGEIIYHPLKIAVHEGKIYLEVHEDIYNEFSDLNSETMKILEAKSLLEVVNLKDVEDTVETKLGEPVRIGTFYTNHGTDRVKRDSL